MQVGSQVPAPVAFAFSSAYVASPVPPVPASVLPLVLVGSSISVLALPSADVGSFVQGL